MLSSLGSKEKKKNGKKKKNEQPLFFLQKIFIQIFRLVLKMFNVILESIEKPKKESVNL